MTNQFGTWWDLRDAHQKLPGWLCVYMACAYAESLPQDEEGRHAIDVARQWLRGTATADKCWSACGLNNTRGPSRAAVAAINAAAFAASAAENDDPEDMLQAKSSAATAAYVAVLQTTPRRVQTYFEVIQQALAPFDLSDPEAKGPILDFLDEYNRSV